MPGVAAAALSGPSFASEVAAGLPVALTAASADEVLAERIVHTLHGGAGARLSIVGRRRRRGRRRGQERARDRGRHLATGSSSARNARAALLTRGLSEMMRYGVALGGVGGDADGPDRRRRPDPHLHRRAVAQPPRRAARSGRVASLAAALASLGHVAEGVDCARAVKASAERARRRHADHASRSRRSCSTASRRARRSATCWPARRATSIDAVVDVTSAFGAAKPCCRHASNTTTATAFDRLRLRWPGRIGRRRRWSSSNARVHVRARGRCVSDPNTNQSPASKRAVVRRRRAARRQREHPRGGRVVRVATNASHDRMDAQRRAYS